MFFRLLCIFFTFYGMACTTQKSNEDDTIDRSSKLENTIDNIPKITQAYDHQIMVLGSFHFNRSLDGSDVVAKNHLEVTTPESQAYLEQLADKIATEFQPTIIATEWRPSYQATFDSLLVEYKNENWNLRKNEAFQIGFRLAKKLDLSKVYCIDNRPPQPETVTSLDDWDLYAQELNQEAIWHEYDEDNDAYNNYVDSLLGVLSLQEYLQFINTPEASARNKKFWLTGLVNLGYGDQYVGADLTGYWYRRNTRIFVNTRNLCQTKNERILVIYGNAHKWLLDELFEGSPEFTVVQPEIYLN